MNIIDFKNEIRTLVNNDVLFNPDKYAIAYNCLTNINYKKLKLNNKSIDSYCLKTLKAISPFRSLFEDPVDSFLHLVFDFKTLPYVHKVYLENGIKSDLLKIESLIKYYESIPYIKQYNLKGALPRNHIDNTILVFYQRTLSKKKAIIDYLLYNLETRALEKSKPINSKFFNDVKYKDLFVKMEIISDFPYRDLVISKSGFNYTIDFEALDYRKINPLRNKQYNFKSDTSNGYTIQIENEIERNFNYNFYLDQICERVKMIPVVSDRIEIFEELRELYIRKKWYGFYALALPQIEGIFSEMIDIVEPQKSLMGSLTNKVQFIRPYYEHSDYYFDYYEFYLPIQRNKFSHSGKDDRIKIKCSFLLLDLVHILKVVEGLNSNLIEIHNIIIEGKSYFKHIGRYSRFIYLIEKVKKDNQLDSIIDKINKFVNGILYVEKEFRLFLNNLHLDFYEAANIFEENFTLVSHMILNKEIKLFSLSEREIIEKINNIKEVLNDNLNVIFIEEYKLLVDTTLFIYKFEIIFPNVDSRIVSYVSDFKNNNSGKLKKLKILLSRLNMELTKDFLITKLKWKHIIS